MSKDRYRPLFCNSDFYLANQTTFKLWKDRFSGFSEFEKVKAWTVCLSCLRRPKDWFGGAHQISFLSANEVETSRIKVKNFFADTEILWPAQIDSSIDLNHFLNLYRIKPIPESALRSLFKLGHKNYPLIVTEHEPEPFELFQIQIGGKRVITFNENYQQWATKLYGTRDPLSFILHDLIHADHFLKDEKIHQSQIGFYKLMDKIKNDSQLEKLFLKMKFKSGFEYIISDMNAHPVHLFQTLRALLHLTVVNDSLSNVIWNQWVSIWCLSQTDSDSVQKVNTELFSDINASQIEVMCFKESLETGLARLN
ncbi:MAG: hypothetical protein H7256_11750 [Bdellovibrio sp.]|nr:hypothetical protein [Bdellovibrio sp.]